MIPFPPKWEQDRVVSILSAYDALIARVTALASGGRGAATERAVFVRADGRAPYQAVARVMARLSSGGFTKLNLITDTAATDAGG